MLGYFHDLEEVLRPAQFKDPAPALLKLLVKTGFEIEKPGPGYDRSESEG